MCLCWRSSTSYYGKKICINPVNVVVLSFKLYNGLRKQHCGRSKNNQCVWKKTQLMVLENCLSYVNKFSKNLFHFHSTISHFAFIVTCVYMKMENRERKMLYKQRLRLLRPIRFPFFRLSFHISMNLLF